MKRVISVDFTATITVDMEVDWDGRQDLNVLDEDDLSPEELERARLLAANQGVDPDSLDVDAIWILPTERN